jgi:hypothetical protein
VSVPDVRSRTSSYGTTTADVPAPGHPNEGEVDVEVDPGSSTEGEQLMRHLRIAAALGAAAASVAVAVTASASINGPSQHSAGALAASAHASELNQDVRAARAATARYATSLSRAKADGYRILTKMIPTMGYHFINPSVKGFDVRKPPILVYERRGNTWQLGALEWVFTSMPSTPPLPGARYGVFGAACHYVDGTVVFADAQSKCAAKSPSTGARFNFWHPRLITLHFWVWYPNSVGIYNGTNPLVAPFNGS